MALVAQRKGATVRTYQVTFEGVRLAPALLPTVLTVAERRMLSDGVLRPSELARAGPDLRRRVYEFGTAALGGLDACAYGARCGAQQAPPAPGPGLVIRCPSGRGARRHGAPAAAPAGLSGSHPDLSAAPTRPGPGSGTFSAPHLNFVVHLTETAEDQRVRS
jgi:hypothetical protein